MNVDKLYQNERLWFSLKYACLTFSVDPLIQQKSSDSKPTKEILFKTLVGKFQPYNTLYWELRVNITSKASTSTTNFETLDVRMGRNQNINFVSFLVI